jgi:hypothetical protein
VALPAKPPIRGAVEAVCAAALGAWAAHFLGGLALQNYALSGQLTDVYYLFLV